MRKVYGHNINDDIANELFAYMVQKALRTISEACQEREKFIQLIESTQKNGFKI